MRVCLFGVADPAGAGGSEDGFCGSGRRNEFGVGEGLEDGPERVGV